MNSKKTEKRIYNALILGLLLVAAVVAAARFIHRGRTEWTDNAQAFRHITPVNTRVQGFVKEVRFEEYQTVKQGDTLVIIDNAEFLLQQAQADAALSASRSGSSAVSAGMTVTASNVRTAAAGIEEARVNMENAKADYERYRQLLDKEAVTRQQYDNVRTRYEAARARYEAATGQRRSTALVADEQAQRLSQTAAGVSAAEAQQALARLNLSYTVIVAPCDGVVGRRDVQVGQLVQPGQTLTRVVADAPVWVVANFRESQMRHIAVGQPVEVKADAVPDVTYKGRVERIAAGTGQAFSMTPVDNATGNFVKVEQRIPVRIALTEDNSAADLKRLLSGLNVEAEVSY